MLVSASEATNKQGNVKKGYRKVETSNGRSMYFTDNKKAISKDSKPPVKKVSAKGSKEAKVTQDTQGINAKDEIGTLTDALQLMKVSSKLEGKNADS